MNNRKQTNKRGKNPRREFVQIAPEPKKLKLKQENEETIIVDNPHYGKTRRIVHLNAVLPKL